MKSYLLYLSILVCVLVACGPTAAESPGESAVIPTEDAGNEPPEPTATSTSPDPSPTLFEEEPPMSDSSASPASSGTANADVVRVRAVLDVDGTWTFFVTVRHPDTGWEDYADGWDVVLPDGTAIQTTSDNAPFTRLLLHPHVEQQPFTRSQDGIAIPDGVTSVTVRAHDLVDGFGGQEVMVDLTVEQGENFVVFRP